MNAEAGTRRELWRQIMFYGTFDRMPVSHWAVWPETMERWLREGFPRGKDQHEFFGVPPRWAGVPVNLGLLPDFPEKVLEETEEYKIVRGADGVIAQQWKNRSCIPHYMDFTLKTAADWPLYKDRLQPCIERIPPDLERRLDRIERMGLPVVIGTGSLMGWIRNWMGVENMSYLLYDDPDCYADMVNTIADLVCWSIDEVVPRMKTPPDLGFGWEDICGKTGPLVSPHLFDRLVAPGYRKIRAKLEHYGVKLLGIDSDGFVEPLLPNWLESGVNVIFPVEPGTWGATPERVRARFGKELRIIGGFNKLALEQDRAAIDAEIERHIPLMREGGFIMEPDHLITPGTPLENYRYYLARMQELRLTGDKR